MDTDIIVRIIVTYDSVDQHRLDEIYFDTKTYYINKTNTKSQKYFETAC